MRTTNKEIDSFRVQIGDRDIILRDLCGLVLVVVVLYRGFDDGFKDEEIHSVW